MTDPDVLTRLRELRADDFPTHGGRTLAPVHDSGLADVDVIGREALGMFAAAAGADPAVFPSLLTMERDLIRRASRLFDQPDAVGTVTSGGTESILLAVKTARDALPHLERPAIVVPSTIHPAFHQAAAWFGIQRITIDVDPVTRKADPREMIRAIAENEEDVVLVAVSAPSSAHGVVDPVTPIAAEAARRGIRMHVDAGIGGWVLPWMDELGYPVEPWTFAVPGVTSISVDLHTYAYAPEGLGLLLYATPGLRRPQFFASADGPGSTMVNPTMYSTRLGGPLAAAWAVVEHLGHGGYRELVSRAVSATREVAAGVERIEHLRVVAPPETTLLTVATDGRCDVFTIGDLMLDRGWYLQPQLSHGDDPASLPLTISAAGAELVPTLLDDLAETTAEAVRTGPATVSSEVATATRALNPEGLDEEALDALLRVAKLAGADGEPVLPKRMAPVNALLDVASPPVRELLLVAYHDRLTR